MRKKQRHGLIANLYSASGIFAQRADPKMYWVHPKSYHSKPCTLSYLRVLKDLAALMVHMHKLTR